MKPIRAIMLLACFWPLVVANAKELIPLTAYADPWPPYIDDNMPSGGVSVEIADAALRTQGYTVTNRVVPWARAIEDVKRGRIDLILDAWWTQERSSQFLFSRPYLDGPLKFIKRKGDPFKFENLASLTGQRLGLVRNYGYGDEFLNATNYDRFIVTDFMVAIRMLVNSRVSLAIENELVARTRIKNDAPEFLSQIEFASKPLSNNYVYVIAGYENPRHGEIILAFNKGLDLILKDGTYLKILQKHQLTTPEMFRNLLSAQMTEH